MLFRSLPLMLAIIGGNPQRFAPWVDLFHRATGQFGHAPLPVGAHSPGHVAETDAQAREATVSATGATGGPAIWRNTLPILRWRTSYWVGVLSWASTPCVGIRGVGSNGLRRMRLSWREKMLPISFLLSLYVSDFIDLFL